MWTKIIIGLVTLIMMILASLFLIMWVIFGITDHIAMFLLALGIAMIGWHLLLQKDN